MSLAVTFKQLSDVSLMEKKAIQAETLLARLQDRMKKIESKLVEQKNIENENIPETNSKNIKKNNTDDEKNTEYELYYWPVKNKGNFIRLIFEECGIKYKEINDPEIIKNNIRSNKYGKLSRENAGKYQIFAPPFIKKNNFILSQTLTIVNYLSNEFRLRPKSHENNALAQQIVAQCNQIQSECYKEKNMMMEEKDSEKTLNRVQEWITNKLQVWMDILESPLKQYKNQKYYFEERCSQADLAVFNILDGLKELFGDDKYYELIQSRFVILNKHYQRMLQRYCIKNILKKQKENDIKWFGEDFKKLTAIIQMVYFIEKKIDNKSSNDDDISSVGNIGVTSEDISDNNISNNVVVSSSASSDEETQEKKENA